MRVYLLFADRNPESMSEAWKHCELLEELLKPGGQMCSVFATLDDAKRQASEWHLDARQDYWREAFDTPDTDDGAVIEAAMAAHDEAMPDIGLEWEEVAQGVAADPIDGRGQRVPAWTAADDEVDVLYHIREEKLRGFTREHAANWLDETLPG